METKLLTKMKWLVSITLAFSFSCSSSSESDGHNHNQEIVIKSITPESGGMGQDMIILGQNFSMNKNEIQVTINGKNAAVVGATMERIFVLVPRRPDLEGAVQVTIGDRKSNEMPFSYITAEIIQSLAGNGSAGDVDGAKEKAQFNFSDMSGIAISPEGNIIVADPGNHKLKSVAPSGEVTTIASGLSKPMDVTFDKEGNMYYLNCDAGQVKKVDSKGLTTNIGTMSWPTAIAYDEVANKVYAVLYGGSNIMGIKDMNGEASGSSNMEPFSLEGSYPIACITFYEGDLYFTTSNHAIYVVRKGTKKAEILVGKPGEKGELNEPTDPKDTRLTNPSGIAFASNGDMYFASGNTRNSVSDDNRIFVLRKSDNKVLPFVGDMLSGYADGQGSNAKFNSPAGIAIDSKNTIYVIDKLNHTVREITVQ